MRGELTFMVDMFVFILLWFELTGALQFIMILPRTSRFVPSSDFGALKFDCVYVFTFNTTTNMVTTKANPSGLSSKDVVTYSIKSLRYI
jgi:hypothetical protein